jgi:methionyl-tRNA synthetase
MKNNFYITTPIYYVNDRPHIGSAYTTIAADILARFNRQIGNETFFLTGTDEHGAKVEAKAMENGKEPQEFVDDISETFINAWKELNISNDNFIRTTDESHIKAVQNALQYLHDKGDIYKGEYKGLYCHGCEQYKNEKDLIDGKCPDHNTEPEEICEETYLFKLSKYKEELLKKIKADEFNILPIERRNEVVSFYEKEGLNDISFSRKNVAWGIPLPWDPSHTAYVWADAFLNYLTGLGWTGPQDKVSEMWPAYLQLMSKDILRVHATIWPAMLLSLGLDLPKIIFVHGYFTIDGKKMSKSLGNVIRPQDMAARYGVDGTRYLLMSATPFGHDGDVSWEKFDGKFNADLANGLGNLVARVSNMLEKNNIELNLISNTENKFFDDFKKLFDNLQLDEALKYIWSIIKLQDEELSAKAPWKIKDVIEVQKILLPIAQNILDISYLLSPFMPTISEKIISQFSQKQVKKGESLFPRLTE